MEHTRLTEVCGAMRNNNTKYGDIIELPHHVSQKRPLVKSKMIDKSKPLGLTYIGKGFVRFPFWNGLPAYTKPFRCFLLEQIDLFTDYEQLEIENKILSREREIQKAVVQIKHKFGKNAILKGMNLENGATTISRNGQVGGHRAWC